MARDNVEVLARALFANTWRQVREVGGAPSMRYGPHHAWDRLDGPDQASWRAHAEQVLLALRAAGSGLDDSAVSMVIARTLYAQIWVAEIANGRPHPGLGITPTWEREKPEARGDYLSIARGVMHDVRAARAAATPAIKANAA